MADTAEHQAQPSGIEIPADKNHRQHDAQQI
jgi:hypothetical protein